MKILVCGGRTYSDWECVWRTLDAIPGVMELVHGGAKGADALAGEWAEAIGVWVSVYKIRRPKETGTQRNARMLKSEPDIKLVVAFPGGNGTADTVRRAKRAGIEVREIP